MVLMLGVHSEAMAAAVQVGFRSSVLGLRFRAYLGYLMLGCI
jgi:hypothetical protein